MLELRPVGELATRRLPFGTKEKKMPGQKLCVWRMTYKTSKNEANRIVLDTTMPYTRN